MDSPPNIASFGRVMSFGFYFNLVPTRFRNFSPGHSTMKPLGGREADKLPIMINGLPLI